VQDTRPTWDKTGEIQAVKNVRGMAGGSAPRGAFSKWVIDSTDDGVDAFDRHYGFCEFLWICALAGHGQLGGLELFRMFDDPRNPGDNQVAHGGRVILARG